MKYYLTYYEEYPIYEPAEGGYYYAGRSAEEWAYDENLSEILNYISEFADKHDVEICRDINNIVEIFKKWGAVVVAIKHSKYIGESRFIRLENESEFKGEECGWHPYE